MRATLQTGLSILFTIATATTCMAHGCMAHGLEIGAKAPDFKAVNVEGQEVSLQSFDSAELIVLVFTCNNCPVAMAYEERLQEFCEKYDSENVVLIAINNSPREDVDSMKRRVHEKGIQYHYVYDGSGESARAYGAQVTPHCFVLDRERTLVYKGAFDDNWNAAPTVSYVSSVVDSLLVGERPEYDETQAVGCAIKLRR